MGLSAEREGLDRIREYVALVVLLVPGLNKDDKVDYVVQSMRGLEVYLHHHFA